MRVLVATNYNRNGGPPAASRLRDPAGKRDSLILAATRVFARARLAVDLRWFDGAWPNGLQAL